MHLFWQMVGRKEDKIFVERNVPGDLGMKISGGKCTRE